MEKIEIELGAWESTLMPIYTANVDVELAERLLYNTMLNYYDEQEIITIYNTNHNAELSGRNRSGKSAAFPADQFCRR
jgi:hypothetical protein